jgi:hypothetical protein
LPGVGHDEHASVLAYEAAWWGDTRRNREEAVKGYFLLAAAALCRAARGVMHRHTR